MKQLHLYFPFVFPMMWMADGPFVQLVKNDAENAGEIIALKEQVEELISKNKELEERLQKLEEKTGVYRKTMIGGDFLPKPF